MRSLPALILACLALLPAAAEAADPGDARLRRELAPLARSLGSSSGIYVLDATDRDVLFRRGDRSSRIIASNAKLFTTTTLLARLGAAGRLETVVLGHGQKLPDGTFDGDLYLRGAGDPSFGTERGPGSRFGDHAEVAELARDLAEVAGITRVDGRIVGDESEFDSLRGTAYSSFRPSTDIGASLSALVFDEGRGGSDAARMAAGRLDDALESRGVQVTASPTTGTAPAEAAQLASAQSPELGALVRFTNKPSSNFYAEMLLKVVGAADGGQGTTGGGARAAVRFARRLGARARIVDGSGLSRGNRASARAIAELLDEMRDRPEFQAFFESLSIAGVDGTLARDNHRGLRRGPARRRCRGKTGTLSNVSAVSGYCRTRDGETIVFSILSNNVNPDAAKRAEDRILHALVRYG